MTFGTSKSLFCGILEPSIGWVRFRGRLILQYKNTKKWPLLFSQRMGITKFFKIGSWVFKFSEQ